MRSYDKRRGWRGPITNIFENKNWENKIKNIKLDKTLKWEIAQVTDVQDNVSEIKLIKENKKGKINFEGLKWTNKKNFNTLLKTGDIIFVKNKSKIFGY